MLAQNVDRTLGVAHDARGCCPKKVVLDSRPMRRHDDKVVVVNRCPIDDLSPGMSFNDLSFVPPDTPRQVGEVGQQLFA